MDKPGDGDTSMRVGGGKFGTVYGLLGGLFLCGSLSLSADAPERASAEQAMHEGAAAMLAGDYPRAVEAYRRVTATAPGLAEGYFNLGVAEQQAGQVEASKADLKHALQLKPGLRGASLFLGIEAYRENRFQDAESSFRSETQIDGRNAKAWMWLGVSELAEEHPEKAVASLERAHALDPGDVDILYHRGRAYFLLANASYAEMFRLNPDSVRVHQALGEAYAESYRSASAISELEIAARMAPRQPGLHEELGDQYWVAGRLKDAAAAYRKELVNDPYAETAKYKLGSLLVADGDAVEGVALLGQVVKEDASLQDAHYYLGKGLMAEGRNTEAAEHFEQAIASAPESNRAMDSWYRLSQIYRSAHDTVSAQHALGEFLRLKHSTEAQRAQQVERIAHRRASLPVDDGRQSWEDAAASDQASGVSGGRPLTP